MISNPNTAPGSSPQGLPGGSIGPNPCGFAFPAKTGWICPRCGRGNAPGNSVCACFPGYAGSPFYTSPFPFWNTCSGNSAGS